jgi:hypothetical protein
MLFKPVPSTAKAEGSTAVFPEDIHSFSGRSILEYQPRSSCREDVKIAQGGA